MTSNLEIIPTKGFPTNRELPRHLRAASLPHKLGFLGNSHRMPAKQGSRPEQSESQSDVIAIMAATTTVSYHIGGNVLTARDRPKSDTAL
jgi:hypothetical protein